jgi:NAD-dependent deacetylase
MVQKAQTEFEMADLVMVGGSSLEVTPAALFPLASLQRGAKLIIINHDSTYLDERADLTIRSDIAEALSEIALEVLDE